MSNFVARSSQAAMLTGLILLGGWGWLAAQEPVAEDPAGPAALEEAAPNVASEPRGGLPNYYSRVVTEQQRKTIYGIQATYEARIDALLAQIEELEKERDAEVEKVLTPEQLSIINKFRADAAAARLRRLQERNRKLNAERP